jgi:hypothetical protein
MAGMMQMMMMSKMMGGEGGLFGGSTKSPFRG